MAVLSGHAEVAFFLERSAQAYELKTLPQDTPTRFTSIADAKDGSKESAGLHLRFERGT